VLRSQRPGASLKTDGDALRDMLTQLQFAYRRTQLSGSQSAKFHLHNDAYYDMQLWCCAKPLFH
jgi:hypothetical protein